MSIPLQIGGVGGLELLVLVLIFLVPFVLVAGTIVVAVWIFRKESDPVETLRDQYARGEIDDEEFDHRMDRLTQKRGSSDDEENW